MPAPSPLLDRVLDADSHEMAPLHFWGRTFGPAAGEIAEQVTGSMKLQKGNDFYAPELAGDVTEINHDSVWNLKGTSAPGAFDFQRRLQVMDEMGVARQLVFPSFAIFASMLKIGDEFKVHNFLGMKGTIDEIRELGDTGLNEYNDWAAATTRANPDRIRCVAYVMDNGTVDDLVARTESLIRKGVRAVNIPHGVPPAGVSPADPAMDEFWGLLEKHNVPLVTHVGNEDGLFASSVWKKNVPAFALGKTRSIELGLEPYSFATLHYTAGHFLAVLTLGGVFERFPGLRLGMIEQGSSWLGPAAENLDMWARDVYHNRLKNHISMLPSEYINRNVRVTPFNDFEPVAQDFRRYPNVADSYCYATDYPHVEGGKESKQKMYDQIAPLGAEIAEKFFVTNSELLMPN
ncbi:amidohydrolase family protein [Amycolatopsis sp. GM8]|uniref:amidohydrolase family protein n=1 Tax=Amycolatopsis sp. GM8 TaxID=2896530 RepID=UPI001F21D735|nr:amidohydrolase family protein [Amycolatopsis sp. GM8]